MDGGNLGSLKTFLYVNSLGIQYILLCKISSVHGHTSWHSLETAFITDLQLGSDFFTHTVPGGHLAPHYVSRIYLRSDGLLETPTGVRLSPCLSLHVDSEARVLVSHRPDLSRSQACPRGLLQVIIDRRRPSAPPPIPCGMTVARFPVAASYR